MLGYEIKEFPRILARPPVDPTDFTYRDIRNRIIALGGDDNGTVRYATRRTFVADLTFEQILYIPVIKEWGKFLLDRHLSIVCI